MERNTKANAGDNGFMSFDPIVLVRDLLKRWYLILLVSLVAGIGAYIITDMQYEPVYQTRTTFVVTNQSSSSSVYSNLSATSSVAPVFSELLNSSLMRKYILEELGTDGFSGSISAEVITETNLLTVTVTAPDPRTAFLTAKAVIEHHDQLTYQVVDNVALEVLQKPVVPTAPSNSANSGGQMRKVMLLTAAAMAVILAYMSYARDVVRNGKEARAKLDCGCLGEIPHEKVYKTAQSRLQRNKANILITNPIISFHYVETIRKIRHRVEQHMQGGKVLMVTSALEDEGKSTVSVNLALALVQKYEKVLIIDCDLRKPACNRLLGYQKVNAGVRSILAGGMQPADAVVYDRKRNLYMLLETKGGSDSGDLVASERMGALIDWARENFDFVVLDLPPMAVVSDTETVMDYADASLLVVRQNAALVKTINKSIAALNHGRAKLIGCVMNNVFSSSLYGGDSYGYGRYGRYGKYGHYGQYGNYARGNSHTGK